MRLDHLLSREKAKSERMELIFRSMKRRRLCGMKRVQGTQRRESVLKKGSTVRAFEDL